MDSFDINAAPLEIERKFLIEYPDVDSLRNMPDYHIWHIEQTYLSDGMGQKGGRIRRITENGAIRYIYTYKVHITDLTRREYERELDEAEYFKLLKNMAPGSITIIKDRHRFTYEGITYELDVYDFWDDKATLEAEVKSEDTPIPIPPCVSLIKEVTHDRRYNNSRLAYNRGVIE